MVLIWPHFYVILLSVPVQGNAPFDLQNSNFKFGSDLESKRMFVKCIS